MSNDPLDTSATSEVASSDEIAPNTNYSRWMTDMAADIAHLKLHQLAIPGAHNSGVDMAGTWGFEELYGACQNNTFAHQLAAGARYLDLRLEDKVIGNWLGISSQNACLSKYINLRTDPTVWTGKLAKFASNTQGAALFWNSPLACQVDGHQIGYRRNSFGIR